MHAVIGQCDVNTVITSQIAFTAGRTGKECDWLRELRKIEHFMWKYNVCLFYKRTRNCFRHACLLAWPDANTRRV